MSSDIERAAATVVARLGRRPVDALEAAVVLEAWGGMEAPQSLAIGPAVVEATRGRSHSWRKPIQSRDHDRVVQDGPPFGLVVGSVVMLLSIMVWMASLPPVGGDGIGSLALQAMPVGLGLQWFLQSRFLAGEGGISRLRNLDVLSVLVISVTLLVAWGIGGSHGQFSMALVVVWSTATILVVRGWGLPGSGLFIVAAIAGFFDSPTGLNVAVVVDMSILISGVAVVTVPRTTSPLGSWEKSGIATAVGVLMGLLVVVGMSPDVIDIVATSTLVVVFSIIGAMWGSFHLNQLWIVTLTSPIDQRSEVPGHSLPGRVGAVIQGSIIRVLGLGVGSLPVGFLMARTDYGMMALVPLVAFVLVMVVAMFVSLVESFAGGRWAIGALIVGCLVAMLIRLSGLDGLVEGIALAGGALTSLIILNRPVQRLINDPGMSIATLI